nr:MAG TPA: hypothetical protein [Caudoviricetes sp.]
MLFICFLMGVTCLNALSRLGWGRLERWGKWRSTDSYRNPQFVTANVNGLIKLVVLKHLRS